MMTEDIIMEISVLLTDKEKIYLSMTSKFMNQLKYKFIYRDKIIVTKINHLPYFDNFECVELSPLYCYHPKRAKYIYYASCSTYVPSYVTHLSFYNFNYSPKNIIPSSVTHLKFNNCFNQSIKNCIPSSVVEIKFGKWYSRSINNIPTSVKKVSLYKSYYRRINDDVLSRIKITWIDK